MQIPIQITLRNLTHSDELDKLIRKRRTGCSVCIPIS